MKILVLGAQRRLLELVLGVPSQMWASSSYTLHAPVIYPVPHVVTVPYPGGTGFVGRTFIRAARAQGHTIVSLSRRGRLPDDRDAQDAGINWVSGDATSAEVVNKVVAEVSAASSCLPT